MASDSLAFALCAWLLTYALHSTVLIGAAWVATALSSKLRSNRGTSAVLRQTIWRTALLGPIATATLQISTGIAPLQTRWSLADATGGHREPSPALITAARLATEEIPLAQPFFFAASALDSTDAREPIPVDAALWRPKGPAEVATTPSLWARLVVACWLAGAILGTLVWAFEWRQLFRCLRGRTPITSGATRARLDELCRRSGVRRQVRLSSAEGIAAPITLGLSRAEICLPPRAPSELEPEELEALLAHELAHAVRHDSAWLVAYRAISILFFFQPLNRCARIRLQDDAEYLADDWAVARTGERVALASCLTEVASWIVRERRLLPAPGMAARGARLSLRIRRLLDDAHHPARDLPLLGSSMAAAGALATVALFAPGVVAEDADPVTSRPATDFTAPAQDEAPQGYEDHFDAPGTDPAATAEPLRAVTLVTPVSIDLGSPPDAALETEAFESAVALHGFASEIGALESEYAELARASSHAPFDLQQRVRKLGLRLQALRARQQRLDALVELQAGSVLPGIAPPTSAAMPSEEPPMNERKERP